MFAAHQVAEPAEHQRPERPHRESRGKCQECENESGRLVDTGEELLRDDRGERAVQVEVVPLEDGSETGSENDASVGLLDPPFSDRQVGRGHGYGSFFAGARTGLETPLLPARRDHRHCTVLQAPIMRERRW